MLIGEPAVAVELFTTCNVPAFRPLAGEPATKLDPPFSNPTVAPEREIGVPKDGPPGTLRATFAMPACVPPHSAPQLSTEKWLSSVRKNPFVGWFSPAFPTGVETVVMTVKLIASVSLNANTVSPWGP